MKSILQMIILLLIFICSLHSSEANSEKIAVVLSRQALPYKEALKGFNDVITMPVEVYNMDGDPSKIKKILETINQTNISVIIAVGSEALSALMPFSDDKKIFYTMIIDPIPEYQFEQNGVVIKINAREQYKRIRQLLPDLKKIGLLYNPKNSLGDVSYATQIIEKDNNELITEKVNDESMVGSALLNLKKKNVQLIWLIIDKTIIDPKVIREMIRFSLENDIPLIGLSIYHVKAGALAAFSIDFEDIGQQTALLVDKTKDQELNGIIEEPRKVIVYINAALKQKWKLNLMLENSEIKIVDP